MSKPAAHENWSSRLGFLMASIGAAVGLGNLWKFPYTLGQSGGGAFVLVYLVAIFLIATPIMIGEMMMGRRGRLSAPQTMRVLADEVGASRRWSALGWWGIAVLFLVLSFFSVIAGWALAYLVKTATGTFATMTADQTAAAFGAFLHQPGLLIFWHAMFMAATVFIVARGIRSGIETAVNLLMPALFVLLLVMVVYAMFAGDFSSALKYLFAPDFSKLSAGVALAAVGQAFFSVNVGIGAVLTYAAYLPKEVNLPRSALIIAAGDTLVALLAGLAIFPIVFAQGLDPAGGPGLVFVTLSTAFGQMPGGTLIGSAFFLLVVVAALTSSISMLEVMVSRAEERPGFTRPRAAALIGAGAFVLGLATVFSFNLWEDVRPLSAIPAFADSTIFDLIDYLVSNIMLPIGGLFYALFAGWWLSSRIAKEELRLGDTALRTWRFLIRFVAPVAVVAILITNLL